jgi:hypothetical protein
LNGHFLGAPCKYVLHGLNPGDFFFKSALLADYFCHTFTVPGGDGIVLLRDVHEIHAPHLAVLLEDELGAGHVLVTIHLGVVARDGPKGADVNQLLARYTALVSFHRLRRTPWRRPYCGLLTPCSSRTPSWATEEGHWSCTKRNDI